MATTHRAAGDQPAARSPHSGLWKRISTAAVQLCAERGFDGFTMDDLADQVGVSRRTLFNHVPSKLEAVLGPPPELTEEAVEIFIAGGPHGVLIEDLGEVVIAVSAPDDETSDDWRLRRTVLMDPRVQRGAHTRIAGVTTSLMAILEQRGGTRSDDTTARLVLGVLLVAFDMAVTDVIEGRRSDVGDRFLELLRHVRDVVG